LLKLTSHSNKSYLPHTSLILNNSFLVYIYYLSDFYFIYTINFYNNYNPLNNAGDWHQKYPSLKYNLINLLKLYWHRVMFKGKGFRVRIFGQNNKITLNFGYSHWTKLKFFNFWTFFKLHRQNYLTFTSSKSDSEHFRCIIPKIKVMNRYTLRGLRLKRQTIKKRFGKISQYVSSLH